MPKNFCMTNQMSISLWVKLKDYYTGPCYNNMLVMKGDADYLSGIYFVRFSDVYTGCTAPTTANGRSFEIQPCRIARSITRHAYFIERWCGISKVAVDALYFSSCAQ